MPRSIDVAAGLGEQRREHRPVALADLAGLQRRTVVDQLVAGRQHGDRRPRDTPATVARVDAGEHAGDRRVARPCRRGTARRRLRRRRRRDARRRPAATATRQADPVGRRPSLGVLDHHDRVGAGRHRRAGHDADRLARRRRRDRRRRPAATSPTTASSTGASATSTARTAYPSTAVLANGGTSSPATTSAASTSPMAARRSTSTGDEWRASGRAPAPGPPRAAITPRTVPSATAPGRIGSTQGAGLSWRVSPHSERSPPTATRPAGSGGTTTATRP